eukprot:5619867-Amphidinium_carterae.1
MFVDALCVAASHSAIGLVIEVIAEYCKATSGSVNRKSRAQTMQMMESVVMSTAVLIEEHGKLMTKRRWMDHAQSIAGDRMTEASLCIITVHCPYLDSDNHPTHMPAEHMSTTCVSPLISCVRRI